jgi:hypothetical protein
MSLMSDAPEDVVLPGRLIVRDSAMLEQVEDR